MKRKKSLIVALAAVLVFLLPLFSRAQVFTLSEEDENGRLRADGGVGWGPGPISDIETNTYLPLGNGIWVLAASASLYLLVKSKKSRRTKTLMLAALALTLGTTQCHKPTETVSENENESPKVRTIYISVTCGNDFYPKADIDVNSGSYTWNDGDCVYVVYNGHLLNATTPLTVKRNETNPVFGTINGSIDVTTEIGDNPKFTFYYVGDGVIFTHPEGNATSLTFNIADQTAGMDIGEYMIGRTKAIRMIKNQDDTKYVADESVIFKPISSVLRLKTTDFGECQMKATGDALNMMEIDLGNPNTLICSQTADITFQSGADVSISVMPTALDDKNNDATVVFTGNGKEGSLTVKDGIKLGTIYAKIMGSLSTPYPVEVIETGMLPGEFSIGNGSKVRFSKGNLQYQVSENKWQFAANQYEYIGSDNASIGSSYNGWIDLFGWGTTGIWDDRSQLNTDGTPKFQKNYQPYSTSASSISGGGGTNNYGYGPDCVYDGSTTIEFRNLSVENRSDWGYNSIYAGSNPTNGWRTLSIEEWSYLFGNSNEREDKYKTGVTVNGKANCVVIAPDECLNDYNFDKTITSYSPEDWKKAEAAGLVCLPPAGSREDKSVSNVGSVGYYWSSTCKYAYQASYMSASVTNFTSNNSRYYGYSVRLVKDVTPSN